MTLIRIFLIAFKAMHPNKTIFELILVHFGDKMPLFVSKVVGLQYSNKSTIFGG
jgi:hypothetical protein